mmetsp:Transcript_5404/g.8311  ORF Transcript_5404/g.8311 Transcript_5404/m.8311 type:complete len:231 (-) Transcript_5404:156-848(-)
MKGGRSRRSRNLASRFLPTQSQVPKQESYAPGSGRFGGGSLTASALAAMRPTHTCDAASLQRPQQSDVGFVGIPSRANVRSDKIRVCAGNSAQGSAQYRSPLTESPAAHLTSSRPPAPLRPAQSQDGAQRKESTAWPACPSAPCAAAPAARRRRCRGRHSRSRGRPAARAPCARRPPACAPSSPPPRRATPHRTPSNGTHADPGGPAAARRSGACARGRGRRAEAGSTCS